MQYPSHNMSIRFIIMLYLYYYLVTVFIIVQYLFRNLVTGFSIMQYPIPYSMTGLCDCEHYDFMIIQVQFMLKPGSYTEESKLRMTKDSKYSYQFCEETLLYEELWPTLGKLEYYSVCCFQELCFFHDCEC